MKAQEALTFIKNKAGAYFKSFAPASDGLAQRRTLRLNNDTGLLKLLGCAFMFCDHAGKMIFPNAYKLTAPEWLGQWAFLVPTINIMRAIGRLAMPLFAYGIAVGCEYTKNIWKYALRLLLVGILVHPLYQAAMGHVTPFTFNWGANFYKPAAIYEFYYSKNLNIFFTLSLSTFIIACIKTRHYGLLYIFVYIAWHMDGPLDYGYKAIILIVLFYAFLDRPLVSFLWVFMFMWYWAMSSFFSNGLVESVRLLFGAQGQSPYRTRVILSSTSQMYAILSLVLIYLPIRKRRVRLPKWFFYGFYPFHLLILYAYLFFNR
ncbi:MAG: hypothetical protein IKR85_08675 [Clostridia bacterium]|nr:hypothetical protein [Clostridia bacterium]